MGYYDEEDADNCWTTLNKFSRNPDRPKRNSRFIAFVFVASTIAIVIFSVLAVVTLGTRIACPCANPYKYLGNGEKVVDMEQCLKDMTYVACYDNSTSRYKLFAGLAGGSGGLLLLSLLLFRYG